MPQGAAAAQNPILSFLPLVIIFAIFYFLLILPQQRKQKKQQEMIDNLKPGEEVVLVNGIYAKIVEIKAETFVVEIAPNTKVRIVRSAVSHKVQ